MDLCVAKPYCSSTIRWPKWTYSQSLAYFSIKTGGEERNRTIIVSKSAVVNFVDMNNNSLFPQAGKMVLFEASVGLGLQWCTRRGKNVGT